MTLRLAQVQHRQFRCWRRLLCRWSLDSGSTECRRRHQPSSVTEGLMRIHQSCRWRRQVTPRPAGTEAPLSLEAPPLAPSVSSQLRHAKLSSTRAVGTVQLVSQLAGTCNVVQQAASLTCTATCTKRQRVPLFDKFSAWLRCTIALSLSVGPHLPTAWPCEHHVRTRASCPGACSCTPCRLPPVGAIQPHLQLQISHSY